MCSVLPSAFSCGAVGSTCAKTSLVQILKTPVMGQGSDEELEPSDANVQCFACLSGVSLLLEVENQPKFYEYNELSGGKPKHGSQM